jgi:hypothetical protein
MKCAKHGDTETSLTCGRCETPICVRCLVQTDVGIRCRSCASVRRAIPGFGSNRFRNAAIVVGIVFVAVLLIGGGSQLGGQSPAGPEDYYDQFLEDYQPDVAATQVLDPWLPPSTDDQPPPERRFVAIEVTIEYPKGREGSHIVSSSYFKLIGSDDFVYGPTGALLNPAIPEGLQLAPGQKTRGWVTFEIDADVEIKSVGYGLTELSLPDA